MDKEFTKDIEEIVTFGFDKVDSTEKVEVNLKDLLYVYRTLQEYMRFFHQPIHYPKLKDIEDFLGSVDDSAGFKILHSSVYDKINAMIPKHIEEKFDNGDFDSPKLPQYEKKRKKRKKKHLFTFLFLPFYLGTKRCH